MMARYLLPLAVLLLSACATGPDFKTEGVAEGLRPAEAAARGDDAVGERVLWGGVILSSNNLPEMTQIEVLGYPLDGNQEPNTRAAPIGRFLLVEEGYLETIDYSAGRRITVVGEITATRSGRIGETRYLYPVVDPDNMHRWPEGGARTEPRFHFGVGVLFSN